MNTENCEHIFKIQKDLDWTHTVELWVQMFRLIVKSNGIKCGFCANALYTLAFDSEIILNGNDIFSESLGK